jgi:hypothetical protein
LEQLALGPYRHILPGAHGQRSGQQARKAGEQDCAYVGTAGADPQHQGQVADQAVVGAEDSRSKRSGEPYPTARGETAQHFAVDPLVGRHLVGGVHVGLVRRAALRALHQGEHKKTADVGGQEDEEPCPQAAAAGLADVVAE